MPPRGAREQREPADGATPLQTRTELKLFTAIESGTEDTQNSLSKRVGVAVGLVANRLKPWTTAAQQSVDEMKQLPFPLVGQLRDTQGYVLMTGLGKSIFDYNSEVIRSHQEDWEKMIRWLKKAA